MDPFFEQTPSYQSIKNRICGYPKKYPAVRVLSIGRSAAGRKLYALGLGNIKNANLYTGATHAQEWLTTLLLLRFFEELCHALKEKTPFCGTSLEGVYQSRGIILVPLVNPDGLEIATKGPSGAGRFRNKVENWQQQSDLSWQANARGVDLNHNFDAGFSLLHKMEIEAGILKPGPRRYGGQKPNSEPETRALVRLCKNLAIQKVFAFHSQGEEIYYSYGEHTPSNAKLLAEALAVPCGYRVCHPQGMASHGGFKDWFIDTQHRCGFTIEIGKGENPLPIEDLEPIYQQLKETLFLGTLL